MKIKFLLLGTSLSFIPLTVNAQCVETTNCETLGYTETSCNGGKGVKCPFGNKWACLGVNEEECEKSFCNKYGFTLTCTGTGYVGGSGQACGGKYNYCNCASGYEWKGSSCQKEAQNGAQGNLYYCNGTVVAVKAPSMDFYVAMKDLGQMNWNSASSRCLNYSFCGNLKGTLPSRDQLFIMYENKSLLNSLLSTNGGTRLTDGQYWSSTLPGRYGYHYFVHISDGNVDGYWRDNFSNGYVRPVMVNY